MKLIGFAIYLGIGAMLHALCVGPQFDWHSAWTFGWLLGWPIMLVISMWAFALMIVLVVGVGWAIWAWLEMIADWRERRRSKRPLS